MPALPEPPSALSLLLHALSGRTLQLQPLPPAPPELPATRPILQPTHLLLPPLEAPLQRAAIAHAAAHLLYSTPEQPRAGLKPLALVVVGALEDARVEQLLARQLPGVRAWFDAPLRAALQAGGLGATALLSRLDLALHDARHPDGNAWVDKARQLFDAARQAHGLEDAAAFRRIASVLANDLGQMRVRFEPRQHAVACAYRDDHSYLWLQAPGEAASPRDLQVSCHTLPPGRQGEARVETIPAPPQLYPEWNHRSGVLRPDWCTLYETGAPGAPDQPLDERSTLRPPAPARQVGGRRQRRRRDGETLDLDATIEAAVDARLGRAPEERIFQRAGPRPAPLSLLLLLDCSLSTAATGPDGRSLLRMEQDAALLLARAVQAAGGRIAVHAFCSDTRARVHYQRLLDFGARLDTGAAQRLRSLQAAWSTRLGAALRHATRLLAQERTKQRALLVLSDGAPSDVDVHDPHYLAEDAHVAVQQARRLGLVVHGLAVGDGAIAPTRRIFGPGRYGVAHRLAELPRQLGAFHARLAGT